eukprot:4362181-Pleurochrysis_carterae.AAC.2
MEARYWCGDLLAPYWRHSYEKDALFFLHIGEPEGEFALSLARRTFDETPEQLAVGEVWVH